VKVSIRQANLVTQFFQGTGEVDCSGAFAHAALVAADKDFVLDIPHPFIDQPFFMGSTIQFARIIFVTCLAAMEISTVLRRRRHCAGVPHVLYFNRFRHLYILVISIIILMMGLMAPSSIARWLLIAGQLFS
jgi:hypothetical protein